MAMPMPASSYSGRMPPPPDALAPVWPFELAEAPLWTPTVGFPSKEAPQSIEQTVFALTDNERRDESLVWSEGGGLDGISAYNASLSLAPSAGPGIDILNEEEGGARCVEMPMPPPAERPESPKKLSALGKILLSAKQTLLG